jgi:hypothetical protein
LQSGRLHRQCCSRRGRCGFRRRDESANRHKAHSVPGLNLFEICANERGRFIRERHRVESG